MKGAWSLAARRSSSCAHEAIETPSPLGSEGGGTERRASGSMPDPGAGASGAIEPGARGKDACDAADGGTLGLWLVDEDDLARAAVRSLEGWSLGLV